MAFPQTKDDLTFDFVIVGAGPSACGLLAGLQGSGWRIAVIEQGPDPALPHSAWLDEWYMVSHALSLCRAAQSPPALANIYVGRVAHHSHHDSALFRPVPIPTGHGAGGSTLINAGLCLAPSPDDLQVWPEPWRSQLGPAIRDLTERMRAAGHVTTCRTLDRDDANALQSLSPGSSLVSTDSTNNNKTTTFPSLVTDIPVAGRYDATQRRWRRSSYYEALVADANDSNVKFFWSTHVGQLLVHNSAIERSKVYGIVAQRVGLKSSESVIIRARYEVILCCGVIATPVLLQQHGLGGTAVGGQLCDHVMVPRLVWRWKRRHSSAQGSANGVQAMWNVPVRRSGHEHRFQIVVFDTLLLPKILPHVAGNLIRRAVRRTARPPRWTHIMARVYNASAWMVESAVRMGMVWNPLYWLIEPHITCLGIFLLNPSARGAVMTCRSRSDPIVDIATPVLSSHSDVEVLAIGWKTADAVVAKLRGTDLFPGALVRDFWGSSVSLNRFATFAHAIAQPYYHWCGTCAMQTADTGKDDQWVVDASLKVRRCDGLRVCDASVFPTIISCPIALTCAGLGNVFAKQLMREYTQQS